MSIMEFVMLKFWNASLSNEAFGVDQKYFLSGLLNRNGTFQRNGIGNQICNRCDLEVVMSGEGDQVRHARHGAVIIHDLADHASRVKPGEPGKILLRNFLQIAAGS